MCVAKTVLVSLSIALLVGANLCIYQVPIEKIVGQHSEIISQNPFEIEYRNFCSSGERFHL